MAVHMYAALGARTPTNRRSPPLRCFSAVRIHVLAGMCALLPCATLRACGQDPLGVGGKNAGKGSSGLCGARRAHCVLSTQNVPLIVRPPSALDVTT